MLALLKSEVDMKSALTQSVSDLIRDHLSETYLKAAKREGKRTFTVSVGAVHKALRLANRVPQVCAALESRKLLEENQLRIVSKTGPPSGQSTTVTFTYEILSHAAKPATPVNPLVALRGVAKDLFRQLGGGETFIRQERSSFTEK
jgi:hypothetical protein